MKRVGDMLKTARVAKALELADIYKFIKIHPKYLEALEKGNYAIFSSSVHVKGFLKTYAKFLELNVDEVLAFWRREYDEKKALKQKLIKPLENPRVFITPASVVVFSTIFLIGLFFAYLYFQYTSYSGNPTLTIENPSADVTSSDRNIVVKGKVDIDSSIYLNGQKINLDSAGKFEFTLDLAEGMNTLNFLAVSRLGKETKLTRTVVSNGNSAMVTLELVAFGGSSGLVIERDGKDAFSGTMLDGTSLVFEASSSIKIKSTNAGVVKLKLNGQDLGLFGSPGEQKEQEFTSP